MIRTKFELFRLSLAVRPQRDFILDKEGLDLSREEYLREMFSKIIKFTHYGNDMFFVPDLTVSKSNLIGGKIGRSFENTESLPPEEGFLDTVHEGWKALILILDPRDYDDGQKAAVEVNKDIGRSMALLAAIVNKLNELGGIYHITSKPISDIHSFWDFAKENAGSITRMTFEFVAPNMFGGQDSIQKELRAFREAEHAQKVIMGLVSADGLVVDTVRVKESVDYVEKGAGDLIARTKKGKIFNSKRKIKTSSVDLEAKAPSRLRQALSFAKTILGSE